MSRRIHLSTITALAVIGLCTSTTVATDSSYIKQRLGDGVNSYQPVVYPVLSYDGQRLYFSRKFHPFNVGSTKDPDDIWFCEKSANGVWSDAVNIGTPLNTPESNVLCSISPTGKTALIQTTDPKGQSQHVFALAESTPSGWSSPKELSIRNFRNDSHNFYASLAYDDSTLLLAIQTPTSDGSLDLYVSFREGATRTFTEPRNLGVTVNTRGTEGSPCLAYDGTTLYFSSDGRGGFGSQDIFFTRRLDSTWRHWSEPENLGPTINTAGLDHCFSLSADGSTAYIVSTDSAMQRGIYTVRIPPVARMGASLVRMNSTSSQPDSMVVELHFETNRATLNNQEWQAVLSSLVAFGATGNNTVRRMLIDSWADSTGLEIHNQHLSEDRLEHVWSALVRANPALRNVRCEKHAHGCRNARFDNTSEDGRRLNRSVRVIFYSGR